MLTPRPTWRTVDPIIIILIKGRKNVFEMSLLWYFNETVQMLATVRVHGHLQDAPHSAGVLPHEQERHTGVTLHEKSVYYALVLITLMSLPTSQGLSRPAMLEASRWTHFQDHWTEIPKWTWPELLMKRWLQYQQRGQPASQAQLSFPPTVTNIRDKNRQIDSEPAKGPFINYVRMILAIFDPLPPCKGT